MRNSDRLQVLRPVAKNWRLLSSSALGVHYGEQPQLVSYFSSSAWKRGWSRRGSQTGWYSS
jgi:hypothetical protein